VQGVSTFLDEETRRLVMGEPEKSRGPVFGSHIKFVPFRFGLPTPDPEILSKLKDLTEGKTRTANVIDNFQVAYSGSIAQDEAVKRVHEKNPTVSYL